MNLLILRTLAISMLVLLCLAACVHTEPFVDADDRVKAGSIASMEMLDIHGSRQSVWLRGRDVCKPAVVLLHGGPGASESALFRHYNAELENDFLVVYWEQRGTGRSYDSELDPRSVTVEQLLHDLDALVDHVRHRFDKQKVVLLGHSWGTVLGVRYAAWQPGKVDAYVGVAQVVNTVQAQHAEREFVRAHAAAHKVREVPQAIERLGEPPYGVEDALKLEGWTDRFGGLFHAGMGKHDLIAAALHTDEADLFDLWLFGRGNAFSLRALWPEVLQVQFDRTHRQLEVPVALFLGRHDRHVPSELSHRWFDRLDAPGKRVVWFEHSAHNPPFEEPLAFNAAVRDYLTEVLPVQARHAGSNCAQPGAGRR